MGSFSKLKSNILEDEIVIRGQLVARAVTDIKNIRIFPLIFFSLKQVLNSTQLKPIKPSWGFILRWVLICQK